MTRAAKPCNTIIQSLNKRHHAILNGMPIISNNDDYHHEALVKRQTRNDKSHDTPNNYAYIPIGSTVGFQCKDDGPWTHGIVMGIGDHSHNDRSYIIHITKTE